jgi:seryl-tRNA synthetase
MLQAVVIREHTQKVLEGLRKRNLKDAESLVQQVLDTDLLRRDTQRIVDDLKFQLNADSRKIGELMKSGNTAEATSLRSSVGADKEKVKSL